MSIVTVERNVGRKRSAARLHALLDGQARNRTV